MKVYINTAKKSELHKLGIPLVEVNTTNPDLLYYYTNITNDYDNYIISFQDDNYLYWGYSGDFFFNYKDGIHIGDNAEERETLGDLPGIGGYI